MFLALAIALCAVEVFAPHVAIDDFTHFQVALALLALMACAQRGSKRERATLAVLAIWYIWIAASDWTISYMPPVLASYEGTVFVILAAWAYFRPYSYVSDRITRDTVSLAFYGGSRAPLLSGLGMLIGLPFSSVALCRGTEALKVDRRTGVMVQIGTEELVRTGHYSFINTGAKITPEIDAAFQEARGTSASFVGPIRGRCLFNLRPILKQLGPGWYPTGLGLIPSIYYQRCLGVRRG